MQIGSYGAAASSLYARPTVQTGQAPQPSRGERLVARLDGDGDGALSASELEGTRIGRRMSVDAFARLDEDESGGLNAGELDAAMSRHGHHRHRGFAAGYGAGVDRQQEVARLADYLAAPATEQGPGEALAGALIERLDGDGSGALNSEEIAGSRLAQAIGDGFYGLDADRSGTLDKAELGGFLASEVLGLAEPAAEAEGETASSEAAESPAAEASEGPEAAAPPAGSSDASGAAPTGSGLSAEQRMADAFETALKLLQDGQAASWTTDIVKSLYGEAQAILDG